jgi:NAD(P)H-hydrate epimerase
MKAVTVKQMRELDKCTIEEFGVPGYELMERAGYGAGEIILEYAEKLYGSHVKRFVIITGKGNNGGDGYVVAKYLHQNCHSEVVIYSTCALYELGEDSEKHASEVVDHVDFQLKEKLTDDDFQKGDIIIDALLGTGVSGKLKKPYGNFVKAVNSSSLPVISLDVPSGINGDTGTVEDDCIMADMTITMGLPKKGLVKGNGSEYCGVLKLVDIGIPQNYIDETETDLDIFCEDDASSFYKRISMKSHKNSVGSVLIIGGSSEYFGAPFLSALSALRSGAGMVRVAIPESVSSVPSDYLSLIIRKIKDNGSGYFCRESLTELMPVIEQSDALVIGPGIGRHRDTIGFLGDILKLDKPMVIDADALNLIAEVPEIYQEKESNILTPHPGEMRRLLDAFDLDNIGINERLTVTSELSQHIDSTVVLKGTRTVIGSPDGRITVNSSGCPALSTAGSGDCLSGIIAAYISRNEDYFTAAATAVYIHGLAGEMSLAGWRGMIADDIPDIIPEAVKRVTPFA